MLKLTPEVGWESLKEAKEGTLGEVESMLMDGRQVRKKNQRNVFWGKSQVVFIAF